MTKLKQRSAALFVIIVFLSIQLACGGQSNSGANGNSADAGSSAALPERAGAFARAPSRESRFQPSRWNLFEIEEDIQVGRQSSQKLSREVTLLSDEAIVSYIRRLGSRLTAAAPGFNYPYEFYVIASKEINAFALPGGFIFVNAGAIAAAQNEGELAGVIAHEIAHVALRHGTTEASKQYAAMIAKGIVDEITGGDSTRLGQVINAIGGAGANVLFLKFGREAEREADLEGARIMSEVGYDPTDMANFFKTLEADGEKRGPEFLSDHPDPGNRVAAIKEAIGSLRVYPNPIHNTQEFERAKAKLTSGAVPLKPSSRPARTGPDTTGGDR